MNTKEKVAILEKTIEIANECACGYDCEIEYEINGDKAVVRLVDDMMNEDDKGKFDTTLEVVEFDGVDNIFLKVTEPIFVGEDKYTTYYISCVPKVLFAVLYC